MKRALTISETAKIVGVSRGTVYNWIHNKHISYEALPGRNDKPVFRIRYNDLNDFLKKNYREKSAQKTSQKEMILLPKNRDYV